MRILLANAPRAYRETMAAVLRAQRPHLGISVVDPEELDGALARFSPRFVICNGLSAAVERLLPAWVVLYPDGERRAVVSLAGRRTVARDFGLADLLAAIDEAEREVPADEQTAAG